MAPLIYAVWVDMETGVSADEFSKWYIVNHAPNLIDSGFLSVRHCRSISGRAPVCTLYELPGHEVFGEAYEESHRNNERLQRNVEAFAQADEFFQTIYEQVDLVGGSASAPAEPSLSDAMSAPVLLTVRFSGMNAVELADWHHAAASHRLMMPGFIRSRAAFRTERQHPHPVHKVDPRPILVIEEWAHASAALAAARAWPASASWHKTMIDGTSEINALHLRYSLLHPDAWSP